MTKKKGKGEKTSGRNVSLTHELEAFVEKHVESGTYRSASEVVRAGLRLLRRYEHESTAWLKQQVEVGLEESRRGELLDGVQVFAELREQIAKRERPKRP